MVIRPQEAKTKKHKAMMENLKKGDSVVTSCGILGKIAGIEAEHLLIEIAQNVKIKVIASHISKVEA
jgi:preprotein translocase subunit YajC